MELGNYDYLMFADVDHSHPECKEDILKWGAWLGSELTIQGIRFDAVKHVSFAKRKVSAMAMLSFGSIPRTF